MLPKNSPPPFYPSRSPHPKKKSDPPEEKPKKQETIPIRVKKAKKGQNKKSVNFHWLGNIYIQNFRKFHQTEKNGLEFDDFLHSL